MDRMLDVGSIYSITVLDLKQNKSFSFAAIP